MIRFYMKIINRSVSLISHCLSHIAQEEASNIGQHTEWSCNDKNSLIESAYAYSSLVTNARIWFYGNDGTWMSLTLKSQVVNRTHQL